MSLTKDFILTRARATRDAQIAVQSKWVWDEKAVSAWDDAIKAISNPEAAADPTATPSLEDAAAQTEAAYLAAQGTKTASVAR